jgi:hypothetical protein
LIILILLWPALLNFSPVLRHNKSAILLSIGLQQSINIHSAKLNDSKVPLHSNSKSMQLRQNLQSAFNENDSQY